MAIQVADYPRKEYAGYFEFVNSRELAEAEFAGLAAAIAAGLPEALERGAAIKRALQDLPPGAVTARVYPKDGEVIEFTGSPADAEKFVVSAMEALKVEG